MSAALRIPVLAALVACGETPPAPRSVELDPPAARMLVGEQLRLTATPRAVDGRALEAEVTWTSSRPSIVEVSGDGTLSARALGRAEIVAATRGASATAIVDVTEGARVGAGGGTVTALAGRVAVELAGEGAAFIAAAALPPAFIDPRVAAGSEVEVHPTAAARLRLRLEADRLQMGVPDAWLRLGWLDQATWRELPGSVVTDGWVEATIDTGGVYSVRIADAPGGCDAPEHRQLDFWVGAWNVTAGGGIVQSDITLDPSGCYVVEHWKAPTAGHSVSFWNPELGMWFQTYVTGGSPVLRMAGGLADAGMVMQTPTGLRFTWSRIGGRRVRQTIESSSDGGATWSLSFDGTYTPR
jgi:hypothetical protein